MRFFVIALSLGLLTAPASAELSMGDFSALAAQISAKAKKSFKAAEEKKSSKLSSDLTWLSFDVRDMARKAKDFKWDLQRLRQRAQAIGRGKDQGKEERDIDPSFNADLRRFVWDLERWAQDLDWKLRDAERIERKLEQGADIRSQANQLVWAARDLETDAGWLERDSNWAAWDFRRIGYSMEAWDVERETRDAERDAKAMSAVADKILKKAK